MKQKVVCEGLSFDDVLLLPRKSEVLPSQIELKTRLTKKILLDIPLISAAMDTVTEHLTAIKMAQEGGIGIIHRNMTIDQQVNEVRKVKKYEAGIIQDPITIDPDQKIGEALDLMHRHRISGIPVTKGKQLVGILTSRDLRFETRLELKVKEVMTKKPKLVTVTEGTVLEEAKEILQKHRIEKLLVIDNQFNLKGLITIKDINKAKEYPFASKDSKGRLIVGAAVGVGGTHRERAEKLLSEGAVDVICVDTAHGHSKRVIDFVKDFKKAHKDFPIIAGNIGTQEGAQALIDAGADAIKVGIGPGSICTTRIVSGVGVPQITAIMEACEVAKKHDIPVIADGGVKFSGDVVKAIAAGADTVMIGSLFAGTDEAPGEMIIYHGRAYKTYRGMGSIGAMKTGSADRYYQDSNKEESKLVPEGIEGRVPYKGSLSSSIYQLVGGIRSGMGYTGSETIADLRDNGQFIKITSAGLRESHVHDVDITKESPNYRMDQVE
jgi:IMP dehydrogenase